MVKPCVLTGTVLVACAVSSRAFTGPALSRGVVRPASSTSRATNSWVPRMTVTDEPQVSTPPVDEEKPAAKASMVVVNADNTEFSAGVLGGVAGFFLGGPVLSALLAVAANYGSKRDNEAGQAVRAISANAIEAFNFLTSINSKYDVTGQAAEKVEEVVTKLKSSPDSADTIGKVEETVKSLTSQASKLSSEYDLPAKARQALGVAGELADTAIDKGIELEKEYKVTDKVKDAVKKSIDGVK